MFRRLAFDVTADMPYLVTNRRVDVTGSVIIFSIYCRLMSLVMLYLVTGCQVDVTGHVMASLTDARLL